MKWLIALLMCTLLCTPVFADDTLTDLDVLIESEKGINIPDVLDKLEVQQGVAYSFVDSAFESLTYVPLVRKWGFTLGIGYVTEDALVGVLDYEVLKLKDYVDIPVLDLIDLRLGLYYGADRINPSSSGFPTGGEDFGATATVVKVTF